MPSLVTIDLDMLQMTGYAAPDYSKGRYSLLVHAQVILQLLNSIYAE